MAIRSQKIFIESCTFTADASQELSEPAASFKHRISATCTAVNDWFEVQHKPSSVWRALSRYTAATGELSGTIYIEGAHKALRVVRSGSNVTSCEHEYYDREEEA
jgi:hypothetical protein